MSGVQADTDNGKKLIAPFPVRSERSLHDLEGGGRRFQRSGENVHGRGEFGAVAGCAERDTYGMGSSLIDREGIAADDGETITQHMRDEVGAIPLARQRQPDDVRSVRRKRLPFQDLSNQFLTSDGLIADRRDDLVGHAGLNHCMTSATISGAGICVVA